MRTATCIPAFFLATLLALAAAVAAPDDSPETKPSASRLQGMKAAISDLENGVLKQKEYPALLYPPHYPKFIRLLKSECHVEWEVIESRADSDKLREEVGGYNDVMRAEIEHRYGRDIFEKLRKRAKSG
jgi:hypothetical protein